MKKFLLALALCTIGFGAQAASENVICSVNGKTIMYEDVHVYHPSDGTTRIVKKDKYDIRLAGLYTCVEVDRADSDKEWPTQWINVKKLMGRSLE